MKLFTLTALVAAGFGSALVAADRFGPLIDPAALGTDLSASAPLILDIRADAYAEGHIPGAIAAPYQLFRGPQENPGQVVPEAELEARLQALGVTFARPVVVVHEGDSDSDFGAAARVYWTLKSSGLTELAILNGGMTAWEAAGLPLETAAALPVPSDIDITFSDEWLADTDEVAEVVAGKREAVLIDARPAEFYEGALAHAAAARPGTLPGAENFSHAEWFRDGTKIVDAQSAAGIAATLGLADGIEVVSFCNTGHWAATDWFALSELAGVPNVKLYPDSMVAWSQTGNAMENVPGLLQNLAAQFRRN